MQTQSTADILQEIRRLIDRLEKLTDGPDSGPDSGGGGPLQGTRHGTPKDKGEEMGTAELNRMRENLAAGIIKMIHVQGTRRPAGQVPVRGASPETLSKAAEASDKLAQALDRAGANEADRDKVAVEVIRAIHGR